MYLESKRLILKPLEDRDQTAMIAILRHEKVKATYMVPDLEDDEKAVKLFRRFQELSLDDSRVVTGIYLGDQLIGWINDTGIDGDTIELGYVIDPTFHNQGYCTEAFSAMTSHLLDNRFRKVITGAFVENPASIRVMEKAGMRKLEHREEIEYRGKVHTCVYYELTK